jgi:hypothetical protein
VKDAEVASVAECFHRKATTRSVNKTFRQNVQHASLESAIGIDLVIDDIDIQNVNALTNCVKQLVPIRTENRRFNSDQGFDSGGNNVTHISSFVQKIIPEFFEHVLDAASFAIESAGWYPHPKHLGVRCIEMLEYVTGGELKYHTDTDSVYTMIMMISDSSEYTGGNILMERTTTAKQVGGKNVPGRKAVTTTKLTKGGALLLDSESNHAVDRISSGTRRVVVFEFWPYQNAAHNHMRPSPRDGKNYYKQLQPILYRGAAAKDTSRKASREAKIIAAPLGSENIIGERSSIDSIQTLSERISGNLNKSKVDHTSKGGWQKGAKGAAGEREGWWARRKRKEAEAKAAYSDELRRLLDSSDSYLDNFTYLRSLIVPKMRSVFGFLGVSLRPDDPNAAARRRLRQNAGAVVPDDDEIAPEGGIDTKGFVLSESMAAGIFVGVISSLLCFVTMNVALYCFGFTCRLQRARAMKRNGRMQDHNRRDEPSEAHRVIRDGTSESSEYDHTRRDSTESVEYEADSRMQSRRGSGGRFVLNVASDSDEDDGFEASLYRHMKSK